MGSSGYIPRSVAVPPPPAISSGEITSCAAVEGPRRRGAVQPPSILTSLSAAQRFGPRIQPASPFSARTGSPGTFSSIQAPFTPSTNSPMAAARGPTSAVSAYNPQEWSRTGSTVAAHQSHSITSAPRRVTSTRDISGLEASLPSPPPPYSASPQSAQNSSIASRTSPSNAIFSNQTSPGYWSNRGDTPISAATSVSSGGMPTIQPSSRVVSPSSQAQQPSPSAFPPPPPSAPRDRSASRSRFNLSSLTSRHKTHESYSDLQVDTSPRPSFHATLDSVSSSTISQPPAARRAASTGAIGSILTQTRPSPDRNTLLSEARNHGYPLPPPPPGPPPNSRTQSLTRVNDRPVAATPNASSLVPAGRGSGRNFPLSPMPPTPADWVDEENRKLETPPPMPSRVPIMQPVFSPGSVQGSPNLRLDSPNNVNVSTPPVGAQYPANYSHDNSIRQRRSESRAGKERSESQEPQSAIEPINVLWSSNITARPSNLVLQSSSNGILSRRRHVSKAKISPLLNRPGRRISTSDPSPTDLPGSSVSLPARMGSDESLPATPAMNYLMSNNITKSANNSPFGPSSQKENRSNNVERLSTQSPQNVVLLRPSSSKDHDSDDKSSFAEASRQRHRAFVERELKATSDRERLELFAEFFVAESRLRRDRYPDAFEELGSSVLDLTRDLWRSMEEDKKSTSRIQPGEAPKLPMSRSQTSVEPSSGDSRASSSQFTPVTEPESPNALLGWTRQRADSRSHNTYQPALSPIPSMAMSTTADDHDSRGRTPSRWWESSIDVDSIGGTRRVERSKRESKYMGLPKEARENLQYDTVEQSPGFHAAGSSTQYQDLRENEYPAEKIGWHEQSTPKGPLISPIPQPQLSSKPRLDVSRLITLPPPYPRHHPALNNNHPDLAPYRATLRTLADRFDVDKIRDNYSSVVSSSPLPASASSIVERRRALRQQIQAQVGSGDLSFAQAAKQESTFDKSIMTSARDEAQKSFDLFQTHKTTPLTALYNTMIARATDSIAALRDSLTLDAGNPSPNQAQEEGDEQPELLEKLTLIKWIFEARETLHSMLSSLESETADAYRSVICAPYASCTPPNSTKLAEVESFFAGDEQERRVKAAHASLFRHEAFLSIVETHVGRGTEALLSAFWDIAPPLVDILTKVPTDPALLHAEFDILIPPIEYDENPTYINHPLQYLYSLLLHAHRSAYQFIESQTNLFCLLHEVKSGVMLAGCRVMESAPGAKQPDMAGVRAAEDSRLTDELQERVALVEEQWRAALGSGLASCEAAVRALLMDTGGWEEGLDE